jgi:hypothetical protein
MKRSVISLTLLLVTLLLNNLTLHAQNAIQYAPVTDYGTLIANIFGIQCEGVSNIQVIAAQPSIGRFENGQSLGLSSGLAMSTGVLAGSNQPSGAFFSYNMGTPPDADIANFGIQNGQVPTNYDATVISFDFTPIVSDTIRFSYVFASEEYPEYAMTSYTDRFLFLVSENGAAASNIAFIPGTTTVVEINSINQFINSQYYVDNTVGSSPNVASFVYDGYTTPLSAKFFAQVGSVYHIKLVIADVSDGVYDSAIFLDEQEAYNTIAGTVNVNNAPAEGLLEIFNFIQDTTIATPIESLMISNGTYNADSLPTGLYHVRFTPNPVLYPNTPPVYFTSGSDWTTATAIGLPCFLSNAGVFSDSLAILNGSGSITGSIVIDTSFLKSLSVPLENALVFLHDAITNDVLAFTYSDAQGNYYFNQIPAGMYYIRLDVPYIPQVNQHQLNLLDGQQFFGVDFDVLTDGIHALNNIYLGVEQHMANTISVYPNPAKNSFYIQANDGAFGYQLCDLKGNILLSGNGHAGLNQLSLSEIANGVYLFKTNTGYTQRVVKQE